VANVTAALLAVLVLRPMRRAHRQNNSLSESLDGRVAEPAQ